MPSFSNSRLYLLLLAWCFFFISILLRNFWEEVGFVLSQEVREGDFFRCLKREIRREERGMDEEGLRGRLEVCMDVDSTS